MITTTTYEYHPLSMKLPLMEGDEFEQFKADIKKNGQNEDIVLFEGKILDGRNRYRALMELGRMPFVKDWDGEGCTPEAFVLSENVFRRHLTTSQRAMFAADLVTETCGGDRRSDHSANLRNDPISTDRAAEIVGGTSPRSVTSALKVKNEGAPELADAVRNGDVSVSTAEQIAKQPKRKQRQTVKQIVEGAKAPCTRTKAPEKPKGPFALIENLIGKLSRAVDDVAYGQGGPSPRSRDIHEQINVLKQRVMEWKQAAR
jgi:hypothetical protein